MSGDTIHGRLLSAAREPEAGLRFLDRRERADWRSFAALADDAARIAGGLRARGVEPGDRVALVLPTCPDFISLLFACHWIGAIPTPMYPPVRLGLLDEYFARTGAMLRSAEVRLLVHDARVGAVLGRVLEHSSLPLGLADVTQLARSSPIPAVRSTPDDCALVQFSSGTTSAPKPVALSHGQMLANARAVLAAMPLDPGERHRGVSWLPLYHDMGLIGCVLPALLQPGELTLIPPELFLARPALWLRAIARARATVSPAPNFAYDLCVERIEDEELLDCDLSSWRYALNGAEPTSARTMRAFTERFAPNGLRSDALTPVYGLSEASLAVTFSASGSPFRVIRVDPEALGRDEAQPASAGLELVSVGRPLRGFAVEIRDAQRRPLPEDHVGAISVRGPSLMQGYLGDHPDPIHEGWLDTGDLGFMNQGELFVTGRAKDLLVIRGRNHAPQDLEAALNPLPGVRTGCSAAVAHIDSSGERLLLFVERRGAASPDLPDRCRDAVRAATGVCPDHVEVLPAGALPRTSSGKIRRAEALRRFLEGSLEAPRKVTPWLLAGAMARSAISRLRPKGTEDG